MDEKRPLSRPRLPRLGLVTTFGLVSLVPIAVIGLVLAHFLHGQVRQRALEEATRSAALITRVAIQPTLSAGTLRDGLTTGQIHRLDQSFATPVGDDVARVKLWSRDGRILYSDDHALIGQRLEPSHELEDALAGEVVSELTRPDQAENVRERGEGRLLEVYVPVVLEGSPRPQGAFELYLSYAPIAAAIRSDSRTLYALLLGGLLALYAALFRIVLGASRALRRQADENAHQALHDGLTGLPNRTLFGARLGDAIAAAARWRHGVAVLLMDLDRFKEVNDTLGHESGDRLLEELAGRLADAVGDADTVARLGGDEFAVLLARVDDASRPLSVARALVDALEKPFVIEGLPVAIEASVGVAVYPDHGDDVDTLLRRADVAMYAAKSGHRGYAVYDAADDDYSAGRLRLVAELRRAIDEGELRLHFQPKQDVATGETIGVEALVRWEHPELGLLPPSEFVPLAQHTSLIKPLTTYVLDAALAQCARWRSEGHELTVAVNVSSRSLLDLELANEVAGLLRRWGMPADALELEITETTIMADPLRAVAVLSALKRLGVRIAIDDYGTGYSSLAYLSGLPVDAVKIDRSFVSTMAQRRRDAVIVRSTIDLGRNLGLTVVAEGVETGEVFGTLRELGCDAAQGYFLARPMPAPAITAWLRERRSAAA